MNKNIIFLILLLLLSIWIFHSWFQPGFISSGDLRIFYQSNFNEYFLFPYTWDWGLQNGLGGFSSAVGWLAYDLTIPLVIGRYLHMNWPTIERIFYLFPFLIINIVSSMYLFKKLFSRNPFFLLAPFIYLFNTYIFMMIGGGQIVGISLAYAIFPIVLYRFIKLIDEEKHNNIRDAIITGLFFSLLVFFDLRFAYMLLVAAGFYFLLDIKNKWKRIIVIFVIPLGLAGLLHTFWILPVLILHQNPAQSLGGAYTSLQSVQYFSFAKFENSISLLHPNWPENIFGKVYFMRPEFLVIPIIAFASLLFVKNKGKKEKYVLYFALLGLLGAFISKGANDPFGGLYFWMFKYVPGFVMFRDPTKWYTLVAISYSVLIPYSVWEIYEWLKQLNNFSIFNVQFSINSKNKIFNIHNLFFVFFILFWLFTIRQAVFGQLGGTFKQTTIPPEYISLEKFLANQSQFSRTLWMPTTHRFGFYSTTHPQISAQDFFNNYNLIPLVKQLNKPQTETLLQGASVKYIIVPYDSQGEIFVTDRKYDNKKYENTVTSLQHVHWLKQINGFGKIAVFEIPDSKDHFWSSIGRKVISYQAISPVEYNVSVKNAKRGDTLVFAEGFDKNWTARVLSSKYQVSSIKYNAFLNSFILPKDGNYTLDIYYSPQRWVNIGVWISLATLILVVGSLVVLKFKVKD